MTSDRNRTALAWADLTYRVGFSLIHNKKKTILNGLNGSVDFFTITALMGPSGAGKTTLLKCLNAKLSSGLDSNSKIFVNNEIEIIPSFVGQHSKDHLVMCLTAKQNLVYASKLKNSSVKSSIRSIDHEMNVKNIMRELMIEDICDTPVENCSGGQQKRLTIGIEMTPIVKPNVLCIDEPTTGLDSNVAEMVMNCLRNLSERYSIAVITSIHQPNHEIVMMFNKIYVLAKGGNCVFSGSPDHIDSYLQSCNILCNESQVPIEQLLKLSSIDTKDQHIEQLIAKTRILLFEELNERKTQMSPKGIEFRSKAFKLVDIWYIMSRISAQLLANQWKALLLQLIFYILLPFMTASMFSERIGQPNGCFNGQTNNTCAKDIEDDSDLLRNQFFLFFITILTQFIFLCYVTVIYINDTKVFVNEHNNRWYSTGSYFLGKTLIETIQTIAYSTSFAFFVYYRSGQIYESHRFLGYIAIVVLSFICTEGYGHNIGTIFSNYDQIAIIISIGLLAVMAMFCNFFIQIKDMPLVMQYMSDWAFPKYAFDSVIILIYGLNRCPPEQKSVILTKFNVKDEDLSPNFYKLVIYAILLRISEYIALYVKNNLNLTRILKKFKIHSKTNTESETKSTAFKMAAKRRLSHIIKEFNVFFDDNENIITQNKNNNQISIAWTDLSLKIPKTWFEEEKQILNRINGYFEFSSLNALMGGSGAGKTSLLKSINGLYSNYLSDETNIYLSNYRKITSCFISQDERDHLMTGITAGEAMTYASKLKNPKKLFDHKKNVESLMKELLIFNTFNTNVEMCSGGEQKRLVIAMELTASKKPNLICIDEPTSGLDSYAAEVVMRCLKRLSEHHSLCIITSIHQPNSDILILFNKIYVLAKGGYCIYSGRPQELAQYLSDCGAHINKNQLPIESILRHSCDGISDPTVHQMVDKAFKSEGKQKRILKETNAEMNGLKVLSKRFFLRDLRLLVMRRIVNIFRYNWKIIGIQFVVYICFGLTMKWAYGTDIALPSGCIDFDEDFNNTCAKTEAKLREEELLIYNINYIFYSISILIFFGSVIPVITFSVDLNLFLNEHRNGWYSTGVFYWCQSLVEMTPILIILLCYCFVINIYNKSMFFWLLIFLTLGALIVQSVGQCLGTILSDNQRLAIFSSVAVFIFSFLFSNFVIPTKEIHYSLQILSMFSPLKLILESVLLLQYGFDRCTDREFSFVLYIFDIEDQDFYINLRLLIIQLLLYRILSMIALLLKVNPMRDNKKEQQKRFQIIKSLTNKKVSEVLVL